MPMGYDPMQKTESAGGRAEPGECPFRIDDAREKTFRSGNEGCEIRLTVAALTDRDITVRDRFVYSPRALWKLERFLASVGCDFARPPEAYELVGRGGRARFKRDANSYLVVAEYLPAEPSPAPAYPQMSAGAGDIDNIPF